MEGRQRIEMYHVWVGIIERQREMERDVVREGDGDRKITTQIRLREIETKIVRDILLTIYCGTNKREDREKADLHRYRAIYV